MPLLGQKLCSFKNSHNSLFEHLPCFCLLWMQNTESSAEDSLQKIIHANKQNSDECKLQKNMKLQNHKIYASFVVFNRVHIELFSRTLAEIACFLKRHKSWQLAEKYGAFAWKRIYEGKTSAYLEYQCSITSLLKIDDSNKKHLTYPIQRHSGTSEG